jgi:hypothetical protein
VCARRRPRSRPPRRRLSPRLSPRLVTEEVPKFRYGSLLNAGEISGISDEASEGVYMQYVYKQYVISGFSTKGDEEEK